MGEHHVRLVLDGGSMSEAREIVMLARSRNLNLDEATELIKNLTV
jgi:hypothetical protein